MALQDIIGGSITEGVAKIISLFKVDPNLALQHQEEVEKIAAGIQTKVLDGVEQMSLAQNEVNKVEAANPKIFISGWRPFIGWVCGFGLLTAIMIGPWAQFIASLFGKEVKFPEIDMGTLLTLLFGMLGLGAMRTYEKVSGVNDTHIKD